jgi:hypothetical protein
MQPLDQLPVLVILTLFVLATIACYEIGFRLGRWRTTRGGDSDSGPSGVLVGSLLALMAFLLAITTGMAAERFNARRTVVLTEANAIGTTWLRAGYLPEPASTETRYLLREYTPLRVVTSGTDLPAAIARSEALQAQLWSIAQGLVQEGKDSPSTALYIASLNDLIDVHAERVAAGIYARVPPTVLWLLMGGTALTLGMVGYSAGLSGRRSPITAVVLIVALGAVIGLVVDLDRPRDGFITVSQQPIIDLQGSIGSQP